MAEQLNILTDIINLIQKTKGELGGVNAAIVEISKNSRLAKESMRFNSPKAVNDALTQTVNITKQVNAQLNEQQKLERALQMQIARKQAALSGANSQLARQRLETQIINREVKQQAVLQSKLTTEYQKLSVRLQQMIGRYKDLAAKKAQNIALTKREEVEYKKLGIQIRKTDGAIKGIDRAVGQNFRNVGNYSSALKGLGGSLRSLLGAFGLTSGVYLFAGAVRDAFQRVREFDKSMQNLAGVMRVNREDLRDLEQTIIAVAGASVRTSNEVAQLAESLATLGKSKDEIKDLLKPIIDLSLGLDAPADEAGEFLVQMLNTFGKSTDSAVEFADTIATIRTSTTLDFQKMRDSFQYIAPISRILNKDLAYTGSVVGILADNGLKAESAGRLLSTAMIKLATVNKTLPEALDEINQLYQEGASELEILTKANDLFGKQSAKVGAILALNSEAIEENAQAIRDNGGALDDLVNQQLESVDAKLKILDSSYEKFILSLDNGSSALGKFTKGALDNASETIVKYTKALDSNVSMMDKWKLGVNNVTRTFSYILPFVESGKGLFQEYTDVLAEVDKQTVSATKSIEYQNKAFIDLHGSLAPLTKAQQELIDKQEVINGMFGGGTSSFGKNEETKKTIKSLRDEIRDLKDELDELETTDEDGIKVVQRKIKAKEAELAAILGVTKATKESRKENEKAIEGSIKYLKEQISVLENLRDTTAVTRAEYQEFDAKIKVFEDSIEQLTKQFENLQAAQESARQEAEKYTFPTPVSPNVDFQNTGERERGDDPIVSLWETRLQSANDYFQGVSGIASGFYDNQLQQIDNQLKRTQDYYDTLIEQAEGNDRLQETLRLEKEQKEKQLQEKRNEQAKKQAVIQKAANAAEIISNTAVAVSKALAQTGFLGGPAAAAFIGALGAAQLAVVLSAPIPEFAEGYLEGNYEGYAKINDASGSNYKEIVERKSGKLEMFNKRNQIIEMQKGDKVHKAGTFNGDDILKQTTLMNMISQGRAISDSVLNNNLTVDFKKAIQGLKLPTPNVNVTPSSIDYRKLAKAVSIERLANKV